MMSLTDINEMCQNPEVTLLDELGHASLAALTKQIYMMVWAEEQLAIKLRKLAHPQDNVEVIAFKKLWLDSQQREIDLRCLGSQVKQVITEKRILSAQKSINRVGAIS